MKEEIWKIPYGLVNENWDLLQRYLEFKGNPMYILVGDVYLRNRKDISDLGNLVGVEGKLHLNKSSIESLGNLEFVNGDLFLSNCENIKTLGNLKEVSGYLNLNNSSIESLGELTFVDGDLDLYKCKNIKTLKKLKRVSVNLSLEYSTIESLGNLEFVGGDLWVHDSNLVPSELNKVDVGGSIIR